MKKTSSAFILILALILISKFSFAQIVDPPLRYPRTTTKPENRQDKFSLALRGKAISFFVIEDAYFSTATLGTELSFKGGHSFGLDLSFFYWRFESDDENDVAQYETYEKRNYLYVDYKYRLLALKTCDFYLNAYDKIGSYRSWAEGVAEGYNEWETPFLSDKTKGVFNQAGFGLGLKKFYSDRFYLDLSANAGKVFTKNNSITYDANSKVLIKTNNEKASKPVFYIRVNFGYILRGNYSKKRPEHFDKN
ncbi:hypothetical protein CNR22_23950 [Sphingobacteriaceae bacterium]|nr:hypothetical protein CNR22_23950 [Sphingobacteriaceae bacterium]